MSISYWLDNSKESSTTKDVVIVGGGIAGLSVAYWLQKEDPNLEILILEKHSLGHGATGRNAGFITCGSVEHFNRLVGRHGEKAALEIWNFSEENLRLLKKEIIKDDENQIQFEHKGSFSLASSEAEFEELKNSYQLMKGLGIKVETLEESDIQKRLGVNGLMGGVKYVDDASVNPISLLRLMRDKLLENGEGVEICEGEEVHSIESQGDVKLVRTNHLEVSCQMIVLATNGYSSLLHPYFKEKIYPTKGQVLATAPVERFMEGPCYANFVLDYFRQLPTGEIIIGGFRQLEKETEIGYSDGVTDKIQSALEEFLERHIPRVKGTKITHRWGGVMGFSSDGQPMVGSIPSAPQIFFLGGFTAHGLGLAFHSGKVLVDSMFGRSIPSFISANRF